MRLKQFIGKNIRGYMNFDISFRDSVTFLIGINGSGKTTVLKLLAGLLTPSYLDLSQIEFSEISISFTCKDSDSVESIHCYNYGQKIKLQYIDSKRKVFEKEFPLISVISTRSRYEQNFIDIDKLDRVNSDFDDLDVVQKIRELKTPLFLGLNRRIIENSNFNSIERRFLSSRRKLQQIESMSDSVDNALSDIQEMFYTHIRRTAQSQFQLSDLFRKQVFEESFKLKKNITISNIDYKEELENLKSRQNNLNSVIQSLEVKDLLKQFSEYFTEIQKVLQILSDTSALQEDKTPNPAYYNALLEWMINRSQLDKIDKIIKYADEYVNNIQNLKAPINRFVDSINLFFKEGHKEIEVDDRGEIRIKINNTTRYNSIFDLSSGEKQLVILLAHIAFYKRNKDASVFVIDEPELSLHISWQEIFVDALLKASPNTQFILATHAPAILAKNERREWCIDLSKRV